MLLLEILLIAAGALLLALSAVPGKKQETGAESPAQEQPPAGPSLEASSKLQTSLTELLRELHTLSNDMYQPGLYTYREIWEMGRSGRTNPILDARNRMAKSTLYRSAAGLLHLSGDKLIRKYVPRGKIESAFRNNIQEVISTAMSEGTVVILVPELTNSFQSQEFALHLGNTLESIAEKNRAVFIDSHKRFNDDPDMSIFTDNVHLTEKGHAYVADLIYPELKKAVEAKLGR